MINPRRSARPVDTAGRATPGRKSRARWWVMAPLVLAGAMGAGLFIGPVSFAPGNVMLVLLDRLPLIHVDSGLLPIDEAIITEIRLPRVVLAALVGGMLAISGAAYQGVFGNPLVDPYLLGSAAGAGLGATLAIAYAPATTIAGVGLIPIAAFVGAMGGVGLSYLLGVWAMGGASRRDATGNGVALLLLAGVAVAAFLTAAQTLIQQQNTDKLQQIYSWILGQLVSAAWNDVGSVLPYAAASVVVLLLHGRLLDALAVGDLEAASLGVNVKRLRATVLLAASLATGAAVAVSGLIGFVGLIVPHMVRRLAGASYRVVLPLSLLAGGALLVLADLVARTALHGSELPIGVVTAFLGAPFFVGLLRANRRVLS